MIRDLFLQSHSLDEARQSAEEVITQYKNQLTLAASEESYLWRLKGISRCLKAISSDASVSDKMALLREITRLADGFISVPLKGLGISPLEFQKFGRFGLSVNLKDDDQLELLLADDDELTDSLNSVLLLDPILRRHNKPEIPDAMLIQLMEYDSYQSATQKSSIRALVTMPQAGSLCVTMPTGSGKSLLFQLGTLWWRREIDNSCCLVIVPTVSLAQDHERTLRAIPGLEGSRALTGEHGASEREEILMAFNRGEVPVLFLSPEMALGSAYNSLITAAKPHAEKPSAARGRLVAVFVDEAHIIESWGRSFRPDFQRIPGLVSVLRSNNSGLRVILLSATLGELARTELHRAYSNNLQMLDIDAQVPRYEFDLLSMPMASENLRDERVIQIIDRVPRPCLLYTTKVDHAQNLYRRLKNERGYGRIELFTGEVSDTKARRHIVEAWGADKLDIVVATSAFGLGIDKADVRVVIHACVPESAARYYQEIGRASRDGHQGTAICVWHYARNSNEKDDLSLAFGQATRQWLTIETSIDRWHTIIKEVTQKGWIMSKDGKRYLRVPLDAARECLGGVSSDYNRLWNMTLLNLLQRAKALEIEVMENTDDLGVAWLVKLIDMRLLEDSDSSHSYLETIFSLRDEELISARDNVNQLREILTGNINDCALVKLFEAIEPNTIVADVCGHCIWCRSNNAKPPTVLNFKGVDKVWTNSSNWASTTFSAGITVIHPSDVRFNEGYESLINCLVETGVEQFVVPNDLGIITARILKESASKCGFVLEAHQLKGVNIWALANLPTAVLLDDHMAQIDIEVLYNHCRNWTDKYPEQSLAMVASPHQRLFGKPLAQVASKSAPYHENDLNQWAKTSHTKYS